MADGRKETGGKFSAAARRFRAVRIATSRERETATQWGLRMGLGQSAVSNFQTGVPISKEAAKKISQRTGIPTDYLLMGDDRYLTLDMSDRIKAALEGLDTPPRSPLPGKRQDITP